MGDDIGWMQPGIYHRGLMVGETPNADGWFKPLISYHWTMVQNIKRDPFEQAVIGAEETAAGFGGQLGAPSTAYLYDWNMLPIGQQLWTKELMSYKTFPPLQAPETYNLDGILKQMQSSATKGS